MEIDTTTTTSHRFGRPSGGYVRPGRLLRYDNVPLNNLFLNMLDLAGAKVDRFGDSTGRLPFILKPFRARVHKVRELSTTAF